MQTWRHVGLELGSHLPFTVLATGAGILLAGVLTYGAVVVTGTCDPDAHAATTQAHAPAHAGHGHPEHDDPGAACGSHGHVHGDLRAGPVVRRASSTVFHVFHPLHMLLSAIATTAMFWRHDRNLLKAILTGIVGSVGVCGLSDVCMPYVSGYILGAHMHFHWCIIEHPMVVLPFMAVGVLTGLLAHSAMTHSTQLSHAGHVFVSSAASIFYLISFGLSNWTSQIGYVFIVVIIAVVIPCCFSDIVFPLLVANRKGLVSCCDHRHLHAGHGGDEAPAPDPHKHED